MQEMIQEGEINPATQLHRACQKIRKMYISTYGEVEGTEIVSRRVGVNLSDDQVMKEALPHLLATSNNDAIVIRQFLTFKERRFSYFVMLSYG